jgi:drug/metabolite transporter (DMT)-like permease
MRAWRVPYALLALTWGSSFWFIKVGLESFSAAQVGFLRVALGAATLLAISAITRTPIIRDLRMLGHLFVLALCLNSAPAVLFAYGETRISSVLAAILNATTPLATLLVTMLLFRDQRPSRAQQLGLVIGFAGVLVVLGVWQGIGGLALAGVAACLLAVTGYGISFPYSRRFVTDAPYSRTSIATAQVTIAALQLAPVVLIVDPSFDSPSYPSATAMLVLGAFGSGIAYVWNYAVITHAGATVASTVTYWTPLVAVVAGIAFLGERITWYEPVGALVVLLGVAVSQGRLTRKSA